MLYCTRLPRLLSVMLRETCANQMHDLTNNQQSGGGICLLLLGDVSTTEPRRDKYKPQNLCFSTRIGDPPDQGLSNQLRDQLSMAQ